MVTTTVTKQSGENCVYNLHKAKEATKSSDCNGCYARDKFESCYCSCGGFVRLACVLIFILIFADHGTPAWALSGHVCTRKTAETYSVVTNKAFLCQERYTTSCGHLDWRRCTKYRVQTCYTPGQQYATRYRQTETCCPGWLDSGGGSCSTPLCQGQCQNGGTCANVGGAPGCVCTDEYYGDKCQYSHDTLPSWGVVLIVMTSLLVLCGVVVTVYCLCRKRKRTFPHIATAIPTPNPTPEANRPREATRPTREPWTTRQSHLNQREADLHY